MFCQYEKIDIYLYLIYIMYVFGLPKKGPLWLQSNYVPGNGHWPMVSGHARWEYFVTTKKIYLYRMRRFHAVVS